MSKDLRVMERPALIVDDRASQEPAVGDPTVSPEWLSERIQEVDQGRGTFV